jgi:uncharacterized membrane protein
MAEFLVAIAFFVIAHVVPPVPPVRTRLIAWFGRRQYIFGYSLLSTALLAWIIIAALRAPYLPLWSFAPWQAAVPIIIMPLAAWLLLIGLIGPNPMSISVYATDRDIQPGLSVAVTRHPVLLAFLLWAVSHIPPNGNVVALTLFGMMALLALAGLAGLDRRARRRLGEERWQQLAETTSIVPFVAMFRGRSHIRMSWQLLVSLAAALGIYVWFLVQGHAWLIGPNPLATFVP